jgi:hypothetical protein
MSKHTPGPWFVEQFDGDLKGDKPISVFGKARETACCKQLPSMFANTPDQEALANARLIAAAPDLLAAAKIGIAIAHTCDCPFGKIYAPNSGCQCNHHASYFAMLASISKAEGRADA